MLPKDLRKPVDDLESASNKILVTCLILAVVFIFGVYYRNAEGNASDCREMHLRDIGTIDSLYRVINLKTDKENEQLRAKDRWQDSVKFILQTEIKNEIKRK